MRLGRLEVCSLGGQFRSQKANTLRESGWNIPFLVWEEKTANKRDSTQLMWNESDYCRIFLPAKRKDHSNLFGICPNLFENSSLWKYATTLQRFLSFKKVFFSRPHCTADLCRLVWLLMPVLGQSWYWLYPHVLSGPPRLGFVLSITFHLTPRWNCLWKYMNILTTAPPIPVLFIDVFWKPSEKDKLNRQFPHKTRQGETKWIAELDLLPSGPIFI